jgi:hypothetical protein
MPRHNYPLTTETIKVLTGFQAAIAEEAGVSASYVYGITEQKHTDPFAVLVHFYAAAKRAGANTCHWRNKLDAIDARYEKATPLKDEVECLTEKIRVNAEASSKLLEALKDGVIDPYEAEALQRLVDKERALLELVELHLQLKRDLRVA